ncbi:carbohydrate-binding protein [Actinoplanes sp. NPDC051475]|uniref:carbohydrate-binding protein n=1 Tax=Actinoplanes sp. NPDC051475 TaxID=3157225 RepID=UPI00344E7F4D
MTTPATPPPGVYTSRSRVTRNRAALAAAGLALALLGYLIGRLQGGAADPAPAAAAIPQGSAAASTPSAAPSSEPPPAPEGGTDAYTTIQAENATNQQGVEYEDTEDEGGGRNVGWVNNGDWLRYDQVNFGATPATRFAARVASDVGDGVTGQLVLHLDSPSAPSVGGLTVGYLGGWQSWQTQSTVITPVSGMHTLFITFSSQSGTELLNLNYFAFSH